MITLNSEYQYVGRSTPVKAYGSNFYYYILLYARTEGDATTGKHAVGVKLRLACSANSTFYKYYTNGAVEVDGVSAIAWSKQKKPSAAWPTGRLTEDGVTYKRWTELEEGVATIDTGYAQKEVTITASWQRCSISGTPSTWLPSTTKAAANLTVLLPEIIPEEPVAPDPEPDPEPALPVPDGIRIYADGIPVCDSRLEDHDLVGLKITRGINVGGTAEIVMSPEHPAYNSFTSQKTIVEIYRNGKLRFRGRALYSAENFYGQRTITCEGELCLLRDSINRPYSYQDTPKACFVALINAHNSQIDPEKQFDVGSVTITGGTVKLECENAETTLGTLNKLLKLCGGYITFTTAADGRRVINWLKSLNRKSNQTIEFGENLLDFSSTGANSDEFATGLIPYGAKDETTKKRLTIESVNDGKDYILDEQAIAVRGTIMATETWDDITDPAELLDRARVRLNERKMFITSLQLTALDLSHLDRNLDCFDVGDMIWVISVPHGVCAIFQLTQLTEDLINPGQSTITMGKDVQSLTGSDVAGDNKSLTEIEAVKVRYDANYQQFTAMEESIASLLKKVEEQDERIAALEGVA